MQTLLPVKPGSNNLFRRDIFKRKLHLTTCLLIFLSKMLFAKHESGADKASVLSDAPLDFKNQSINTVYWRNMWVAPKAQGY